MSGTIESKEIKFYTDEEERVKYPDCYQLVADFEKREISTNCGDYYYDLTFSFDDFLKFAKEVEKLDTIYNKDK